MNKMIDSFLKFVPSDDWVKNSSKLPWLKLNLEVPIDNILTEANNIYPQAIVHRSDDFFSNYSNQGLKSLSIYGESATTTIQTNGHKNWTKIADFCPHTVDFVEKYWEIDDTTGRIRFMWLEPKGYILPHQDRDKPFFFETNVAITQPEDCRFRFLNYGTVPFTSGSSFLVDISNKHLVVNNSNLIRIHLIVHAKLKPGIIRSSYEQNFYN